MTSLVLAQFQCAINRSFGNFMKLSSRIKQKFWIALVVRMTDCLQQEPHVRLLPNEFICFAPKITEKVERRSELIEFRGAVKKRLRCLGKLSGVNSICENQTSSAKSAHGLIQRHRHRLLQSNFLFGFVSNLMPPLAPRNIDGYPDTDCRGGKLCPSSHFCGAWIESVLCCDNRTNGSSSQYKRGVCRNPMPLKGRLNLHRAALNKIFQMISSARPLWKDPAQDVKTGAA